jgi:hypothetical protein
MSFAALHQSTRMRLTVATSSATLCGSKNIVNLHHATTSAWLCRFDSCEAEGSFQACPPGMNQYEECPAGVPECYSCPSHRDCYVGCDEEQWGRWFRVPGSPYNEMAFCERFPRLDPSQGPPPEGWAYLAQAGKAVVPRTNFDNIYSSIVTIFQILTGAEPRLHDHEFEAIVAAPTMKNASSEYAWIVQPCTINKISTIGLQGTTGTR